MGLRQFTRGYALPSLVAPAALLLFAYGCLSDATLGSSAGAGSTELSGSGGGGGAGNATTGSGGGGLGSGGGPVDPSTAPMEPSENQWTFVPFPDSKCGNGSPTGIGLNTINGSKDLLIYLMDGGGCASAEECSPDCAPDSMHCAKNIEGYDAYDMDNDTGKFDPGSIFDRKSSINPFANHNYVLVPYCTGDFHSGHLFSKYDIYHVGFSNITIYLKRIVPTFSDTTRVVLAGTFAGGFGAVFNYEQVKAAFDKPHGSLNKVRVDLIDDSGPLLPGALVPPPRDMQDTWGSADNAPADCDLCKTSWSAFLPFLAMRYPDARISFVNSLKASAIEEYFKATIDSNSTYEKALRTFARDNVSPALNARVFYTRQDAARFFLQRSLGVPSEAVVLSDFLRLQKDNDPQWISVVPPPLP